MKLSGQNSSGLFSARLKTIRCHVIITIKNNNRQEKIIMIKYVLFDLDGTLLPMDQDIFVKAYFGELTKKTSAAGYKPEAVIKAVWSGMKKMLGNNGSKTNEDVFWECFRHELGDEIMEHRQLFDDFYKNEFNNVSSVCPVNPKAKETISMIKSSGLKTAVATLPVFPAAAIEARINWAGIDTNDLEFYTSYETCRFTKPNIKYYENVLAKTGARAEECLMVGNNVDEDMIASELGMKVFLLTDCLINDHDKDISVYNCGSFNELQEYIKSLM